MRRLLTRVLIITVLCTALSAAGFAAEISRQLAPGVSLRQEINTDPESALVVSAVTVDLNAPSVRIGPALSRDKVQTDGWQKGREGVSTLTGRKSALVGVNADFFPFTGDPLGVCMIDGELISEPGAGRVGMAVLEDGSITFDNPRLDAKIMLPRGPSRQIEGINRPRETNQVIAYTDTYGASTQSKYKGTDIVLKSDELPLAIGREINLEVVEVKTDALNTPIPKGGMVISSGGPAAWFLKENLKPGDQVRVLFNMKSPAGIDWTRVRQAVGGGPWLVKDGKTFIDCAEEGFKPNFSTAKHPRTAVGVTADGKLLMVTVDGRQFISKGITLPDLSKLMIRLGAKNAINLDGGGSTTMSVGGMIINSPSDGTERLVANSLLLWAETQDPGQLPNLTISGAGGEVEVDEGVQLFLTWGDDSQMLTREQLDKIVWGVGKGIGFVNQQGFFVPLRVGEGTIQARYGKQTASLAVKVVDGLPAFVNVALVPDTADSQTAEVKVTVLDRKNNKLSGRQVVLEVTGGYAEEISGVTDADGGFSTEIHWAQGAVDRLVKASTGEISGTAVVPQPTAPPAVTPQPSQPTQPNPDICEPRLESETAPAAQ